jgi:hypothetical protein
MRRHGIFAGCIMVLIGAGALFAGVDLHINLNLGAPPAEIEFDAAPAVVVVSPGISVVPDYDREVFFTGGFYWTLQEGHWYRCARPHERWVVVEARRVPPGLAKMPHGKYKNWHPSKDRDEGGEHHHDDEGHGHGHGHGKDK